MPSNVAVEGIQVEPGLVEQPLERLASLPDSSPAPGAPPGLRLVDTFEPSKPRVAAAEQLLADCCLQNDPVMPSLVRQRRGRVPRPQSREPRLDLTSDARKNIDVLVDLTLARFIKLRTDVAKLGRERHEYSLVTKVTF